MIATDVCVVGGGPAGLAAARDLRRAGVRRVLLVERESAAGGIPRHAGHLGFGLGDLHRLLTGPDYARRMAALAVEAGVEVRLSTTATDWSGGSRLLLTGPGGRVEVQAEAIVLATGCRERPRAARLVPGSRPLGVLTTGALQQLVYLGHHRIGRRAVIVGAEHVSFSAIMTLAHGGARTVAMVTELGRHQTYLPLRLATATPRRVPVRTRTRLTAIFGRERVEGVELTDLRTGTRLPVECDTVVFTGDWTPDNELSRRGGLAMAPTNWAPRIDSGLRTSNPGVFAAGNLVHAAETSGRAAISGRHVVPAVVDWLSGRVWPAAVVAIKVAPPLRWVSPSALSFPAGRPAHGRLILRSSTFAPHPTVLVTQAGRNLWRGTKFGAIPNRPLTIPSTWMALVQEDGGEVTISME